MRRLVPSSIASQTVLEMIARMVIAADADCRRERSLVVRGDRYGGTYIGQIAQAAKRGAYMSIEHVLPEPLRDARPHIPPDADPANRNRAHLVLRALRVR